MMILSDERVGRSLLLLTIPAFFGMLVTTLYNVVDTIFIGHYVGALGIAGLSIVFPVQMLSMGMGQMSGMGGASVISRFLGAGKEERAQRALGNSLGSTIILCLGFVIIGEVNPDFWLRLLGASEDVLPYAREYMVIIFIGITFQTIAMSFNGLIRAEGNSRVSMIGMIIGAALNIILDAIFIIPLDMGIAGAAWATVIAQLVSVVYFLYYYYSGKSHLKLTRRDFIFDLSVLKPIYAIGVASLAMTFANSLSGIVINRVLGEYGGDYAIATFGIMNRILMFAIMPGIVIGQGLQPILGYNYGAKRYRLSIRVIYIGMAAAGICSTASFCVLYFLPHVFIKIFTEDAYLIETAVHAAKCIFFFIYLVGFGMVGNMIFQALGRAVKAFVTSLLRPAILLMPLVIILPRFMGTDGVWWGFGLTDGLTGLITLLLVFPEIRHMRRKAAVNAPELEA